MPTSSPTTIGTAIEPEVPQVRPSFVPTLASVDPRNVLRVLVPLDGEEVIKAIVKFVETMLRNSGKFNESQIYEELVWRFRLEAQWSGYANTSARVDGVGGAELVVKLAESPVGMEPSTGEVQLEGSQLKTDLAPDEVRELTGQPIPVLQTGINGGKVVRVEAGKLKRR